MKAFDLKDSVKDGNKNVGERVSLKNALRRIMMSRCNNTCLKDFFLENC